MARRLPTKLQISHAENFFCERNPPCDALDLIDMQAVIDGSLTMRENIQALQEQYPQFNWSEKAEIGPSSYEKEIVDSARKDVGEFSYDILKKSKIESLQRAEGRSRRLQKKLEICETQPVRRPSRPGVCDLKTVEVVSHRRCAPRK